MNKALFPGSFDPITIAHLDLVLRSYDLFDSITIGIGINSSKSNFLSPENKLYILKDVFKDYPKINIETYTGLTTNFCEKINAKYIIRGIRSTTDYEYEKSIELVNKSLNPNIETIFLLSKPEYSGISSTIVRDILLNNGNIESFVPKAVVEHFERISKH